MAVEIERRFLVSDWRAAYSAGGMMRWQRISQGYFGRIDGLRTRVRILTEASGGRRAVLTFKGPRRGPCRMEYEYPLALDAAQRALCSLPGAQIIRKIRFEIRHHDGLVWSVDRFQGANAGLVIAEVELDDPDQTIELPPWVGAEVTLDRRYGNSRLAWSPVSAPLANTA
jgi:CYTH domain-containing protein